jgi:hypothetical protein
MKQTMLVLAVLGAVTGAWADPNDLWGGVLIPHYVAQIGWCVDPPAEGWCAAYDPHAISSLAEVVVQVPVNVPSIWYVLAAWEDEEKTWCGTEFGFGNYNASSYVFYNISPCYPTGGLEIPTPGWPGPDEGTAFVTTGDAWNGNWVPVYFFSGQAYDYYGYQIIMIDDDPPTSFCGFSNCLNPPQSFAVPVGSHSGLGIAGPGMLGGWPHQAPWACCIPQEPWCEMVYETQCAALGGVWHLGLTCAEANCPEMWACCVRGICTMMFEENCTLVGGNWMPDVTCDPNPCPAVCCYESPFMYQECGIMLEAACAAASGHWHPEWVTCDPNPCEIYSPTESKSWGQIKSMYR